MSRVVGNWPGAPMLLMWDLTGALGKPGSPLKIIVIGTLAHLWLPGRGHWYWDLVHDGTKGSTYVKAIQGQLEGWDTWGNHPQGRTR